MANKIFLADTGNSYFNQILLELRDEKIQQDRARFRKNIGRAAQFLGYEISKYLPYKSKEVTTPLGTIEMDVPSEHPVIVSILRAGIPMHMGLLEIFDHADNGFISAYRHHTKGNEFIVKVEYNAIPSIAGRQVILADPMIATGKSIVLSYEQMIKRFGQPEEVYVAAVIASEQGMEYVQRNMPNAKFFIGVVDKELTAKAYIVPGLGDAGDLAFGDKE